MTNPNNSPIKIEVNMVLHENGAMYCTYKATSDVIDDMKHHLVIGMLERAKQASLQGYPLKQVD